jgi:hypothetical protein
MSTTAFHTDTQETGATVEPTGASLYIAQDPLGTGCMACCSGGVDPTWGGVVSASSVAI